MHCLSYALAPEYPCRELLTCASSPAALALSVYLCHQNCLSNAVIIHMWCCRLALVPVVT